jgi:serine/threonine-protein kinase
MARNDPVRPAPLGAFPAAATPATLAAGEGRVTTSAFKPGDRLGQLDIGGKLGEGLHGEVFLASHRHTGEKFALKAMWLEDAKDARKVQRYLRTAAASYRIRCKNVVTVHDLGCEDNGVVWVLMELLEGRSVAELLARQGGRVSLRLAFHIAIGAAWGIDAAHDLGVIHRDIKPANLWLCTDGTVKVLDFGLAKVVPDGVQTTKRAASGTLPYMAPETLHGYDPDARVDIYALGVVLWELLGRRHPWADALTSENELVRRLLHVEVPPLSAASGLPRYVDDFMARAVAKDPGRRFFAVAEMAQGMMTLSKRLLTDAERGLFVAEVPPGEPQIPADRDGWREHVAWQPAPDPAELPEVPEARVMLSAPAGPGGTLPLSAPLALGPSGTLPFGAQLPGPDVPPCPAPSMRAVAQPASLAAQAPTLRRQPIPAPLAAADGREIVSELPTGVAHPSPRRLWAALVVALIVGVVVLLAVRAHARPPAVPIPAPQLAGGTATPAPHEVAPPTDTVGPKDSAVPERSAETETLTAEPTRSTAAAEPRATQMRPHTPAPSPKPPAPKSSNKPAPANNRLFESDP